MSHHLDTLVLPWHNGVISIQVGMFCPYAFVYIYHGAWGGVDPSNVVITSYISYAITYCYVIGTIIVNIATEQNLERLEKKKTLEKEEEPAEVAKREESSKVNDNIPGRRGVDQKDLAAVQNVIKGQIKAEEDHAYYMAHTIGSYYDASTGKLVKQEKPTEEKRRKRVSGYLLSLSKRIEPVDLATYSIKSCIKEALDDYSFKGNERKRAKVRKTNELNDLQFKGSKHFVKHILFNLLKNALDYAGEKAMITIWAGINRAGRYQVIFKDDICIKLDASMLN